MQAFFQAMGSPGASTYSRSAPHPYMQKTRTLGLRMVVGGDIALVSAEAAIKCPSDGYTTLIAGGTFWTLPMLQKTSYDLAKDFAPITTITQFINVLAVRPSMAESGSGSLSQDAGSQR